jgi:hypothetical protein
LRSSVATAAAGATSGAPQDPQNRNPAGLSKPQREQRTPPDYRRAVALSTAGWNSAGVGRPRATGRIRAVLVGIDRYARADVPVLRGCANDVMLVRRVLKGCYGLGNEDIRVLVDDRATKAAILHRLAVTAHHSRPGDVVVLYFSGHGSQIRDRDGDELTDALDELLCPHDMDWDRGTYVLDDDVDEVFGELPPGVLFEGIFDCCFWGAGPPGLAVEPGPQALRDDLRYLPPPIDIAARAEGEDDRVDLHLLARARAFAEGNVFWAASREGRTAAEDVFEGRPQGIFTYALCRAIEAHVARGEGWVASRQALLEEVRARVHALGYAQTPELSAPDEHRAAPPFTQDAGWDPWAEADPLPPAWRRAVRGR